MQRSLPYLIIVGASALACAGPRSMDLPGAAPPKATDLQNDVATVNGHGITATEFDRACAIELEKHKGMIMPKASVEQVRKSVLLRMIEDKMISLKAEKLGVSVEEADVDRAFAAKKKAWPSEAAFMDYVMKSGRSAADVRGEIRTTMLTDKMVEKLGLQVAAHDDDLEQYFRENKHFFREQAKVQVGRILVHLPSQSGREDPWLIAESRAESIQKGILEGADFNEAAKSNATNEEDRAKAAPQWVSRNALPKEFDDVVFSIPVGSVSKPIRTGDGFEIVKVWDRKEGSLPSFEVAKPKVLERVLGILREKTRRQLLSQIRAEADIKQLIRFELPE